ncbi:MAG: glucan ABC transporter ATP-binding protein/ permease [Rhizobiaceae bacterium]
MSLLEIYWRALRYLAPAKRPVFFVCAANIVLAFVTIAEPILFGKVIQSISDRSGTATTLAMWAGLGVFNIVAFVLVAREADRLAHRRRLEVLEQSFSKVIGLPLAWHQAHGSSNVIHTLLRASDTLATLWLEFMRQHLSTAVALALMIPTAIAMDVRLSIVLIALGVLYFLIGRVVTRKTKSGQTAVETHNHNVFSHLSDSISNVAVLQSYNRIHQEARALQDFAAKVLNAQYPVLDWWALASALNRVASTVSMMIVLMLGAYFVSRGELRVGDIIAFTGFAQLLISRLDQISQFVNQIFDGRAKLEKFYELEDAGKDVKEDDGVVDLENVNGHIVFDNVNYVFSASGQGVHDISFEVKPGQTVAIVGPTGSGKTTLLNLLQRVYEPSSGRILIDGVDVKTVSRKSLRQSIATVFQDAGMFNRSIEANIRLGNENAGNHEIHEAAAAAAAEEFILAKSEGYDTMVGERGAQLSGGERQRIAIARAILKNAPILVLDEATSALDVETEERIKCAIDEIRRNRTTFIIAHRLSTVRDADIVIFLDHGQLVELGSFNELASRNGRFASLLRAGGLLTDAEVRRVTRPLQEEAA